MPSVQHVTAAHTHLVDHYGQPWAIEHSDVDLRAGEAVLPAHKYKCVLARWSQAWKAAIDLGRDSVGQPDVRSEIPLDDGLEGVQDLLKLIYRGALDCDLHELHSYPAERSRTVIILADKHNMPVLLQRIDSYLCNSTLPWLLPQQAAAGNQVQQAITWAETAAMAQLSQVLSKCEDFIAKEAAPEDMHAVAHRLPLVSALRIVHSIMLAGRQNADGELRSAVGRQLVSNLLLTASRR